MKNIILALIVFVGFAGSFLMAGECANGICVAQVRPVRKVVNITKEIIVAPVRSVVTVATPGSSSTSKKEVVKYQPLRRRLVNRSTTVSCYE